MKTYEEGWRDGYSAYMKAIQENKKPLKPLCSSGTTENAYLDGFTDGWNAAKESLS